MELTPPPCAIRLFLTSLIVLLFFIILFAIRGCSPQTFHNQQMAVGAYTFFSTDPGYVNKLSETEQIKRIRELADMKVDWIETDNPGKVKEILDSMP